MTVLPDFRLEIFEGPLDLLLSLISKNKVNIYDIPIALIFEQYMAYLDEMKKMDMEIAGEFIVMASELMLIKSRMLLPKQENEEEEDPRAKLAAALIEYKKAKEAAVYLSERYGIYSGRMIKDTDEYEPDITCDEGQDIELLTSAFRLLLRRAVEVKKSEGSDPSRAFGRITTRPSASVPARTVFVMRYLFKNGRTSFTDLMLKSQDREELIASFLALLELVHAQRVTVSDGEDGEYILELNRKKAVVNNG